MTNILEFKTRNKIISKWFNEVISHNGILNKNVKSVIVLWEEYDEKKDTSICMHAKYNCDATQFEWFKNCMEKQNFRNQVGQYLRENINDFLEYID